MPGKYQFPDIETIVKCKIFHELILAKANQKALFLVYVAHNHKRIFLYEVIRGSEITLKDIKHLNHTINFNTFKNKVKLDSYLDSNREVETVFEHNNLYIGITSTEYCRISNNMLDSVIWEMWGEIHPV